MEEPGKESQDDRQGKMLLHTEYSLLSLLHHQDGVVHHHGLFKVPIHHCLYLVQNILAFRRRMGYCKHGYFRWGKISQKCCQDLSRAGNFHDASHISFIKSYGVYFCEGEIFAKKANIA